MPAGGGGAKITHEVEAAVLALAGTHSTAAAIAHAVHETHGFTIARRTVAKILERTRAERSDVAKNIVREVLTKTVVSDLDILAKHRDRLDRLADRAGKRAEAATREDPALTGEYRKTVAALTAVVDKRLHYSGADTPDAPADELKAATQRLHGRLDRLASAARAGSEAPGDSPDPGGRGGA